MRMFKSKKGFIGWAVLVLLGITGASLGVSSLISSFNPKPETPWYAYVVVALFFVMVVRSVRR